MRISIANNLCLAALFGLASLKNISASFFRMEDEREDEVRGRKACSLSMWEAGECTNPYHVRNEYAVEDDVDFEDLEDLEDDDDNEEDEEIEIARNSNFTTTAPLNNTAAAVDSKLKTKLAYMMLKKEAQDDVNGRDRREHTYRVFESRWGEDQVMSIHGVDLEAKIEDLIHETDMYMNNVVFQSAEYRNVRRQCKNMDKHCSENAVKGYCQAHPGWMLVKCAPACRSCDMLDAEKRCPVDHDTSKDAWGPGDLNTFFERITNDTSPLEAGLGPVEVLSRPRKSRRLRQRSTGDRLPDGPWIVSIEQFISDMDIEQLFMMADKQGYQAPFLNGETRLDGTAGGIRNLGSDGQLTGYKSSCIGHCMREGIAATLVERLSTLTQIPEDHIENLELVRYEEGQFYEGHYDFSFHELHRPQGVRLMTIFIYLNDVEEGGETEFINLKTPVSVTPKRGKALIFGNVLDQDPNTPDRRTKHEALQVKQGVKYGINIWFHQRDFRQAYAMGCTSPE